MDKMDLEIMRRGNSLRQVLDATSVLFQTKKFPVRRITTLKNDINHNNRN